MLMVPPPGLEKIYQLTNTPTRYELRFDLGVGSDRVYAVYDDFKIATARQKFKLTVGKYSGTAGESFASQISSKLSAERKNKKKTTREKSRSEQLRFSSLTFAEDQNEARKRLLLADQTVSAPITL